MNRQVCIAVLMFLAGWCRSQVFISEFMADNASTTKDNFGSYSDWIELYNNSDATVSLDGWKLFDDPNQNVFIFPATNIPARSYMLIWASGTERKVLGAPLHTKFKLSASGENLYLTKPDGSLVQGFQPFPAQLTDQSYGILTTLPATQSVITASTSFKYHITTESDSTNAFFETWATASFADTAWPTATGAIGEPSYGEGDALVGLQNLGARYAFTQNPMSSSVIPDEKPALVGTNWPATRVGTGAWIATATDLDNKTRSGVFRFFPTNTTYLNVSVTNAHVPAAVLATNENTVCFWMCSTGLIASAGVSNLEAAILMNRRGSTGDPSVAGNLVGQTPNGLIFVQAKSAANAIVNTFTSSSRVDDGRWHHIAVTHNGGYNQKIQIFIDGILDAEKVNSAPWAFDANMEYRFGAARSTRWYRYSGDMDDIRIYGRVLTEGEISRIVMGENSVASSNLTTQVALPDDRHTLFLRYPFTVVDPALVNQLNLRISNADGYVIYLNGHTVAQKNAPDPIAIDSAATGSSGCQEIQTIEFIPDPLYLQASTNILAVQVLRQANPSYGLQFSMTAGLMISGNADSTRIAIYTNATPGKANTTEPILQGARIQTVSHTPLHPAAGTSVTFTTTVDSSATAVTLLYKDMYATEQSYAMTKISDNGTSAVWRVTRTAPIDQQRMFRYAIQTSTAAGQVTRQPSWVLQSDEPQYFGDITASTETFNTLPVIHLFVNPLNQSAMDLQGSAAGGTRCSVYCDGEFYDNVYIEVRGNSTASLKKKSHALRFNKGYEFRHPQSTSSSDRVRKTSFISEYQDPSYLRQYLSFWLVRQAGAYAPFDYPVRLQMNQGSANYASFYQVAFHSQRLTDELLETYGLDKNGELYKNVGVVNTNYFSTGGFEKKTPVEWIPNVTTTLVAAVVNSNYLRLASGVSTSKSVAERRSLLCNECDIPALVNYLAYSRLAQENDDVWANLCLYYDINGTKQWIPLAYDRNNSWGSYFKEYGYSNDGEIATIDAFKCHPFYGGTTIIVSGGTSGNFLFEALLAQPDMRAMLTRRMRTLLDRHFLGLEANAETTPLALELRRMQALLLADTLLDRAKWGFPYSAANYNWGTADIYLEEGISNLINNYIVPRRRHFLLTHALTNTARATGYGVNLSAGIPPAQRPADEELLAFDQCDFNPASGNQEEEYLRLTNRGVYAVDLSNWKIKGGISFSFASGTVIPANASLYLAANRRAFLARTTGPSGNQGLVVVGDYSGKMSARGEQITLVNASGEEVQTFLTPIAPTPAQSYLRITEIMFNPKPNTGQTATDAQVYEYIKLKNCSTNVTLNLSAIAFTSGIDYAFSTGVQLAPGAVLVLATDAANFQARYGFAPFGVYSGKLSNEGELLRLSEPSGEKILEFTYGSTWYASTAGAGASLMLKNPATTPVTVLNLASSWYPSLTLNGEPGAINNAINLPYFSAIRINELLAHTDPPQMDTIELYNEGTNTVDLSGWTLSNSANHPDKYAIPAGTTIGPKAYRLFTELNFNLASQSNRFVFSAEGDDAVLTNPQTGYQVLRTFETTPNGVSLGHHVNSQGESFFVLQASTTLGATNGRPWIPPLVISKIHYAPSENQGYTEGEYIELCNRSATPFSMGVSYPGEPQRGIYPVRLAQAVSFAFNCATTVQPGERIIVVPFDPSDAAKLHTFKQRYGQLATMRFFGPYVGSLNNSGSTLEVRFPDYPNLPDALHTNYWAPDYAAERITYSSLAPWPTNACKSGLLLTRRALDQFANEPTNWTTSTAVLDTVIADPVVAFPTAYLRLPASGGTYTLAIEANCGWRISQPLFGGFSTYRGSGSTNLVCRILANARPYTRKTVITLTSLSAPFATAQMTIEQDHATPTNSTLRTGLTHYYPFDGSLVQADGLISDTLTAQNITFEESPFRQALSSGRITSVATNYTSFLPGTNDFSVSLWVKTPTTPLTTDTLILSRGASTFSDLGYANYHAGWSLTLSTNALIQFNWFNGTNQLWSTRQQVQSSGFARIGQWNHLALTRQGKTFTLYLNGQAATITTPTLHTLTVNATTWGAQLDTNARNLSDGLLVRSTEAALDECAFWNRALSVAEIAQLNTTYSLLDATTPSSLNINFTHGTAATMIVGKINNAVGVRPVTASGWNEIKGDIGQLNTLYNSHGWPLTETTLTILGTRGSYAAAGTTTPLSNDARLLCGYIDDSAATPIPTVIVTNVPFARYHVIVYAACSDANVKFGPIGVGSKTNSLTYYTAAAVGAATQSGTATWGDSKATTTDKISQTFVEGGNYLKLPTMTGSNLVIRAQRVSGTPLGRATISAIQIVEELPTPLYPVGTIFMLN